MSEDKGAPQTANQEIDIDELEVDILIVAKNPANMKQTCSFLSRRGWPTTALGNITKAIEEIADKKPDIVMISLNHPSPAVLKLPDIIAQSFNLICVGFVETNDAASAGKLAAIKLRHKINGSPSGPNFHRGLRKILAEKFNINVDEKTGERAAPGAKQQQDDKTVISSGEKGSDRTVISGKKEARGPVVISGKNSGDTRSGGSGGPAYMPDHSSSGKDDGKSESDVNIMQEGEESGVYAAKPGKASNRKRAGSLFGDEAEDDSEIEGTDAVTNSRRKRALNSLLSDSGDINDGTTPGAEVSITTDESESQLEGFDGEPDAEGNEDLGSVIQVGREFKKTGDKVIGTGKRKKLKALTGTGAAGGGNMNLGENLDPAKPRMNADGLPDTGAEVGMADAASAKSAIEALAAAEAAAAAEAGFTPDAEGMADMRGEGVLTQDPQAGPVGTAADSVPGAEVAPLDGGQRARERKVPVFEYADIDESTPQGKMEKAVAKAMSEICLAEDGQQAAESAAGATLGSVCRIGVFPVDSTTFPGYLVVALDAGSTEDQALFLRNCEGGLRSNLQNMGVSGSLEPGFWLDVPEVSFEQWTADAGTFKYVLNHRGREVGVSFFKTDKPIAKATPSEHKEMYTIALGEISTEEPVTFKTYLHLKENNKFYMYLRDGRQLQPEQKKRLEASGMANFFMKDTDVDNFRMFLAATYLKETIRNSGGKSKAA